MTVYVAISYTRNQETEVVGVAASPEGARSLVETYRKEPLSLDEHGCLNNYPAEGPPDMVGHVLPHEVLP